LNHDNMTIIEKTISISHHSIKFFSDMGVNIIVDQVLTQENWMDECVKLLYEYPVIFVHVTCPLEELQRREKERGDRGIGWAENQLMQLNPKNNIYDINVDTYNESNEECVNKIIGFMNKHKEGTAFKTLWEQL
ncbi:MAG: chloramphenicol phosphotransferase CPT family protein, partial [Treponema sp.]|nr:chloramphenicol phosphotransferase CPT family protein [Treponema sp.]